MIDGVRQCDLSSCEKCEDVDEDWRNGCESAQEIDLAGIFVTRDTQMNCWMMQREVGRNPELFNRHLHIDLSAVVTTSIAAVGTLPPAQIFCNDGLIADSGPFDGLAKAGTCFFMCEDGYSNVNNQGYDGCENRDVDGIEYMPEWRRWPTDEFHENNCLYWDGDEWFAEEATLGILSPVIFENDRNDYCSLAKKKK
jgi:hypothetical protein